jgi:hypothetical protein
MTPKTGRKIKEDGTIINIADAFEIVDDLIYLKIG